MCLSFSPLPLLKPPLCRGRKIALSDGSDSWVSFHYERLPNLCYWCGKLTHMDRECPIWFKGKGALIEKDHQFGSWLRASTPNLARKTLVKVAGLEEESPTLVIQVLPKILMMRNMG